MKKLLILILCCLVGGLKAQSFCEVDSVYTMFDRETTKKIIQTADLNFVLVGCSGLNGGLTSISYPKLIVTKINGCGEVIWRNQIDEKGSSIGDTYGYGVLGTWEQVDSSIVIASESYVSDKPKLKLYKINSKGQLIWMKILGDSNLTYYIQKCIQVNDNKFLFVGSCKNTTDKSKGIAMSIDSLGNVIHQFNINENNTSIFEINKYSDSTIIMLGNHDSLLIIHSDFELNNFEITKIAFHKNLSNSVFYQYSLNSDGNEIFFQGKSENYDTIVIARINLQGGIIKYALYSGSYSSFFVGTDIRNNIIPLNFNRAILFGHPNRIIDSSLNFIWQEDTAFSNVRNTFNATLTQDSFLVSVGHGPFIYAGTGKLVADFWFGKKKAFVNWVKQIQIIGPNFINQNSGSIQLSAQILPATATNKTIIWSVDDTSKAFITQTGLLTAKANGVVTVIANTTDGSNLSASKQITITNQGVGLLDEQLLVNQVNVFPNPANTFVSVQSTNVKIYSLEIMDVKNKTLSINNNTENIDISNFSNGYYFLKVETEKGTVLKKLIITK